MKVFVKKEGGMVQVFPAPRDKENWYEVEVSSEEDYTGKQFVPDTGTFEITSEIVASEVRSKRDKLMQEADILVNKAVDIQDVEGERLARAYRQALRDVPEQEGFPYEVVWPTKPT